MSFVSEKTVIGLTGSIACGKSTALQIFGELGWETISTDALVASLLNSDKEVINEIKDRWGESIFSKKDGLNKAVISEIIFGEEKEKAWLEDLLHPRVRSQWMRLVEGSGSRKVVLEIPLLFEKNLQDFFTYTISVQCSKKVQLQRLIDRGLTKAQSTARIEAQLSMGKKSQLADIILLGENSLSFLKRQIRIFHARVT